MRVFKVDNSFLKGQIALLEATLYIEKSSFVPSDSYLFEALDYHSIDHLNLDDFKAAIAFYLNSVLGTNLYVISVPRASLLCPIERKMY
jgi:hypothetical protein